MDKLNKTKLNESLESARKVFQIEGDCLKEVSERLDVNFLKAIEILFACEGKIVVTGIGKSGHIGKKIAATLASTGSPAFFVHPAEANHGDLGMISSSDAVIAISYSGENDELNLMIPGIKSKGIRLISLSGNQKSTLSAVSDVNLSIEVSTEACPLGLAPTSSSTAALVMGDALAISLLRLKGFGRTDFALSHPAGSLGKRLTMKVSQLMHTGAELPSVSPDCVLKDVILEISSKRLGMTTVLEKPHRLLGVITDGDLRRLLENSQPSEAMSLRAEEIMSINPKVIHFDALAVDALTILREKKMNHLVATDLDGKPVGVIGLHDLVKAQIV